MRFPCRFGFILALAASTMNAQPLDDVSTSELVASITTHEKARGVPANLIREAGKRGIEAALACAVKLNRSDLRLSENLCQVISSAGRIRRFHPEVLRLYDPAAYRLFYEKGGAKQQEELAVALAWEKWPQSLPAALVRAAPLPTLEWISQQATSKRPRLGHLQLQLREWAKWMRYENEMQHADKLYKALELLASSDAVLADTATLVSLLTALGQNRTGRIGSRAGQEVLSRMESFAARCLRSASPNVRSAAAGALGRFASDFSHQSLLERLRVEEDVQVIGGIVDAIGLWTANRPEAGQAMLSLFKSCGSAGIRKKILYAAERSDWPQRSQIILAAFKHPDGGVLGAALELIPETKIDPKTSEQVIKLVQSQEESFTSLVDAAGATRDPRVVPQLHRWLNAGKNDAVRLKIVLALEKIGNGEARAILLNLLQTDTSQFIVEHLIGVVDRMQFPGAAAAVTNLARDETAPESVRSQALWAMGGFKGEKIGKLLDDIEPEASNPESAEIMKACVALAQFRRKEAGAAMKLQESYRSGSPAVRFQILMRLEELKRDHPVIGLGLDSTDFIELYGAVRAAGAANPTKYLVKLKSLHQSSFVKAVLHPSVDSLGFKKFLDRALTRSYIPEGF